MFTKIITAQLLSAPQLRLSKVCSFLLEWLFFSEFVKAELIKLAKMAGVMHEADYAYSIRSTW